MIQSVQGGEEEGRGHPVHAQRGVRPQPGGAGDSGHGGDLQIYLLHIYCIATYLLNIYIFTIQVAAKLETSSAVSCVTWQQKAARLLDRGVVRLMSI